MAHPLQDDAAAEAFEAQRDRLRAVAYRMLGSHADAEDVVQEAWLRLSRQDARSVRNLPGWLTTVVGRISLDVLRARRTRPEEPYDDALPEPAAARADGGAPEQDAALADAVGAGLGLVLDALGPDERLAFVLHDLFAVPFQEIGPILGRSADAAKMLASRARRKVRAAGAPTGAAGPEQWAVVRAFLAAARNGEFADLLRLLDPEVELTVQSPDGPFVVLGATRVAAGAQLSAGTAAGGRPVHVEGLPGFASWRADGSPLSVIAFTVVDGRIAAVSVVTDPARLAALNTRLTPVEA